MFDWRELVEDNARFGEPGVLNLWRIRKTDPGAMGVNPCGEIPLHDREACNLAEFFPANTPDGHRLRVLRLITRYCLRQRLEPLIDPVADEARTRNMRIGVGLGGICDFDWTPELLRQWRVSVRAFANVYADELGVRQPNFTTTVKPSGTISLLAGSSPGIHRPRAPWYLRRTRISVHEPMAKALMEAGVPHEPCVYDKTGNTLVFAFPMAAPAGAREFVSTETVRDQVERQIAIQTLWADNAVSTTISYHEHEKEELADLLTIHGRHMKSISLLPAKHGYQQPPYENIDQVTFEELNRNIRHDHPLTAGGDLEVDECATGACPIR
jgi:ribonucleoside-triphosphate reductase